MPSFPVASMAYEMEAASFDLQTAINLYAVVSESGSSKSAVALRSVPGYSTFATMGSGFIRGGIETNGRAFFVSGNEFYELFSDGTTTKHGDLDTLTGIVQISENPTQIMIIDSLEGYIFTKATNTFAKISDTDFPVPSSLTFQDGYFIVSEKDTSKYYISNLNNGLAWDTLDFTTVEGAPDKLVAVRSNRSNLWAFGSKITEVYQNTGNALFPFQKIQGAFIQTGCAAPNTIQNLDNSLLWLGIDENGDGIVWRSNGYNAQRISTQAIERKIASSTFFEESYAWTYHERGHAFYVLQIKGLDETLVYDVSTKDWRVRASRDPITADMEQHRGSCHIYAFNKHLIGDRVTNKVYEMDLDNYTEDGNPFLRKFVTPHIDQMKELISHKQLELDMETGVGLTSGQGSDPQIMMRYSDDNGKNWSSELWLPLGKKGEYGRQIIWNRLGRSRDRVYEFTVSDPVFVQFNEIILNGQ